MQGELGSNSALAAAAHFQEERISIQPCPTFNELFEAVEKGQAHYGMAPVENSLAGSIHAVWDLLALYKPAIVGEIYYHVRHCLIGHPGARLEDIRYVYSHPQALAQCGAFLLELENLDPNNIVEEYDTAGAVEIIRQTYKKEQAAIASSAAAELHQMKVLATDIQTHERNYTRFLVLGQRPATTAPNKTVLVCTLDHTAANLPQILAALSSRDIPLYKAETRKLEDNPWAYLLYLECQGDAANAPLAAALAAIKDAVRDLSLVVSYPAAPLLP